MLQRGICHEKIADYRRDNPDPVRRVGVRVVFLATEATAVKVLSLMQERQAAKVLAELTDAGLAAQLIEKLKGLRRAPANVDGSKQ